MRIILEIPREEYLRYDQYYKPWELKFNDVGMEYELVDPALNRHRVEYLKCHHLIRSEE